MLHSLVCSINGGGGWDWPTEKPPRDGYLLIFFIKFHSQHFTLFCCSIMEGKVTGWLKGMIFCPNFKCVCKHMYIWLHTCMHECYVYLVWEKVFLGGMKELGGAPHQ